MKQQSVSAQSVIAGVHGVGETPVVGSKSLGSASGLRGKGSATRSRRPGPVAAEPKTEHGKLIHARLQSLDKSQSWLAKQVGVQRFAINKYIHETRGSSYGVNHRMVCEVLGFDSETERQYLASWYIFPDETPSAPAYVRCLDFDIGALERITKISQAAMRSSSYALRAGHNPRGVLGDMADVSKQLHGLPYTQTDPAIVTARINADMFLAALQEAVLPWWGNRAAIAIDTYDRLEEDVFRQIGPDGDLDQYARLCLRRAVLRREGKEKEQAKECEREIRNLGPLFERVGSPLLAVAYSCQYLHTLAVIEEWDLWRDKFDEIRRTQIDHTHVSDALRARLLGILAYAEGVGFKRFMWSLRGGADERMRDFASHSAQSLGAFTASNGAQAVHDINLYHEDIPPEHVQAELESSAIDALIWCRLEEAHERALSLQQQAQVIYPAMLGKVTAQLVLIERLMGRRM